MNIYLPWQKFVATSVLGCVIASLLLAGTAWAKAVETTGEPGSPGATISIDGKQLPPPPDRKFGGKIERSALESTPYWPPRIVPPKGAPNILLIMTDDAGYGISSTFGGVIPTPAMDRIADNGLRYSHFHSTAVCSPTRAALLTGRSSPRTRPRASARRAGRRSATTSHAAATTP